MQFVASLEAGVLDTFDGTLRKDFSTETLAYFADGGSLTRYKDGWTLTYSYVVNSPIPVLIHRYSTRHYDVPRLEGGEVEIPDSELVDNTSEDVLQELQLSLLAPTVDPE